MKYVVRLVIANTATIGNAGEVKTAALEDKRTVFTVLEKVFGGLVVPNRGDNFPIYGRTDESSANTYLLFPYESIEEVSHDPRQQDYDDGIRTPVVTVVHSDTLGMMRDRDSLTEWAETKIRNIDGGPGAITIRDVEIQALVYNGFRIVKGPSLEDPFAGWGEARLVGVPV